MSKFKNLFAAAAAAIFAAHHNLNEIYITSDGQGFTDEEKAKDNARYHKDTEVKHFQRGFEESFKDDAQDDSKKAVQEDAGERESLFAQYEELFEKRPSHNIGTEKLKTQILEKKEELEALKNADQGGSPDDLKKD